MVQIINIQDIQTKFFLPLQPSDTKHGTSPDQVLLSPSPVHVAEVTHFSFQQTRTVASAASA